MFMPRANFITKNLRYGEIRYQTTVSNQSESLKTIIKSMEEIKKCREILESLNTPQIYPNELPLLNNIPDEKLDFDLKYQVLVDRVSNIENKLAAKRKNKELYLRRIMAFMIVIFLIALWRYKRNNYYYESLYCDDYY